MLIVGALEAERDPTCSFVVEVGYDWFCDLDLESNSTAVSVPGQSSRVYKYTALSVLCMEI